MHVRKISLHLRGAEERIQMPPNDIGLDSRKQSRSANGPHGAAKDRLMLISADCHFGLPMPAYKQYLPSNLHGALDDWIREGKTAHDVMRKSTMLTAQSYGMPEATPSPAQEETIAHFMSRFALSREEAVDWVLHSTCRLGPEVNDSDARMAVMDADGVAAEVLIQQQDIPFGGDAAQNQEDWIFDIEAGWNDVSPEMMMDGARAYHRALVDICSAAPDRRVGLSTVPTLKDMDRAIEEVKWAADHGLKGVLIMPSGMRQNLPALYHPHYDRFWAACVDYDMPVHWHVGPTDFRYGTSKNAGLVMGFEIFWWAHRPLWHLMFGGVLKNYPKLQMVFTELAAQWVPRALEIMDSKFVEEPEGYGAVLPAKPSEMWRTNCHVGVSCMSHAEAHLAPRIGIETVMFGTDFPHQEMTWPHSGAYINKIMGDMEESQVRAMCGTNAAKLYGFDIEKLKPVAERVGHPVEEILNPEGSFAKLYEQNPLSLRGDRFGDVL
jgi:predicted TIM-barrel fold metal-dependent hydrolase